MCVCSHSLFVAIYLNYDNRGAEINGVQNLRKRRGSRSWALSGFGATLIKGFCMMDRQGFYFYYNAKAQGPIVAKYIFQSVCQLEMDVQFVTKHKVQLRHGEIITKSSFTWSVIYTMDRVRLSSISIW